VELVSNPESPQGFLKPTNDQVGWSFVRSVPEDSGGLVGPKYQDYISGRARNLYLGSLGTLNRLVVKVPGSVKFDNPTQLGASTIYLIWQDSEGGAWSANAKWLVYGWDHEFTEDKEWYTYVYCRRYDADAAAKIV
jgi:hypothetical protein